MGDTSSCLKDMGILLMNYKKGVMMAIFFFLLFITPVSAFLPDADRLLSFWDFEQTSGTIINDTSGNGFNGTAYNISFHSGFHNLSMNVSLASDVSLDDHRIGGRNNRTVTFWVNISSFIANMYIFSYGALISDQEFSIGSSQDTETRRKIFVDFNGDSLATTGVLPVNAYSMVSVTYNGTEVSIYINDTFVISKIKTLSTVNTTISIGKRIGGGAEGTNATLDLLRIYNRSLNQSEIGLLFNNSVGSVLNLTSTNTTSFSNNQTVPSPCLWNNTCVLSTTVSDDDGLNQVNFSLTYPNGTQGPILSGINLSAVWNVSINISGIGAQGDWNVLVSAIDNSNVLTNYNWSFNITDQKPVVVNVSLNPVPNGGDKDLNAAYNTTDVESNGITIFTRWWKNNVYNGTWDDSLFLGEMNFTHLDNLTVNVTAFDGLKNSTTVQNSTIINDTVIPVLENFSLSVSSGVSTSAFTIFASCSDASRLNSSYPIVLVNHTTLGKQVNISGDMPLVSGTSNNYSVNYTPSSDFPNTGVGSVYNFTFYCRDLAGNEVVNGSVGLRYEITATPGGGGSSGGGGDGSTTITQVVTLVTSPGLANLTISPSLYSPFIGLISLSLYSDSDVWTKSFISNFALKSAEVIDNKEFNTTLIGNSTVVVTTPFFFNGKFSVSKNARLRVIDVHGRTAYADIRPIRAVNLAYSLPLPPIQSGELPSILQILVRERDGYILGLRLLTLSLISLIIITFLLVKQPKTYRVVSQNVKRFLGLTKEY